MPPGNLAQIPGKVITLGIGKSGFIAAKVASTLTSLGVSAVTIHPTDLMHGDLGNILPGDTVIAFSHSGNTKELLAPLAHVHRLGVPIVAVTGHRSSRLVALAKYDLVYHIDSEGSPHDLAPMASTTISLVIGDMLAAQVATLRGFTQQTFAKLHPSGTLGLQLTTVGELMIQGGALPVIEGSSSFHNAVNTINTKRLGVVAVIDGRGHLIGALTDGDVRRFILSGRPLADATVTDAMTAKPLSISADLSLLAALQAMESRKITSLFITSTSGKLEGLIHIHQIVERQLA